MSSIIKDYNDYANALHHLWIEYDKVPSLHDTLWLGTGIANYYHENVDLLWMGINPSCTDGQRIEKPFPSFEEILQNPDITYWKTVKRILEGSKFSYVKEHLDLFAIRKTPQDFLRKVGVDKEGNPALHFLAKHLWYTQQFLENYLKPKVIVLANKAAGAYLGLDSKYVWMGYKTKEVITEIEFPGKVYKIIGIRNEERLIRQDQRYNNQLNGTLILHSRFQGNGCPRSQQIEPQHIDILLELAGLR